MKRFGALSAPAALGALAALSACSTVPGTGWSRAPDLSVYSSMRIYARTAIDQAVLCDGTSPAWASNDWEREYGARQEAVTALLAERYGADALVRADAAYAPSVACGDAPDPQWRNRYARLLRLLETRFGLARERDG